MSLSRVGGGGGTWFTNIREGAAGKSEDDTLSRSKSFLDSTLSFVSSDKIVPCKVKFFKNLTKIWEYCHPIDLNRICRGEMAYNDL